MSKILIAYVSERGQTKRIAERIAQGLRDAGHTVDIVDAGRARLHPPEGYDAIVLGSALHAGRHARGVSLYVRAHRAALERVLTAFFTVSLSVAAKDPKGRADAEGVQRAFLEEVGLRPARVASFGGSLDYTKYNLLVRFIMKRISASYGGPVDTRRDHELTDWADVDRFTAALADDLARGGSQASRML